MKEYTALAIRTENVDYQAIRNRMTDSNIRLLHALMGVVTEAGELLDQMKKHLIYGKPLDLNNLIEEHGDSNWYLNGLLIDELQKLAGVDMNESMRRNIEKLRVRYPDKYTDFSAINRDLESEAKKYSGQD